MANWIGSLLTAGRGNYIFECFPMLKIPCSIPILWWWWELVVRLESIQRLDPYSLKWHSPFSNLINFSISWMSADPASAKRDKRLVWHSEFGNRSAGFLVQGMVSDSPVFLSLLFEPVVYQASDIYDQGKEQLAVKRNTLLVPHHGNKL